jgi:MFS transporter, NNP family, nitrate/nitrite transporter
MAAMVASSYAFLNLVSRPSGGLISDRLGSRKWTMTLLSVGIGVGYMMASRIDGSWSWVAAALILMMTAYFAQAGCGGTYSIVPLIRPEMTGQIAGNVGAYGNFGGVVYLTIHSLYGDMALFTTMGLAALVCASCCAFFLREPQASAASVSATGELSGSLAP